MRNITGEVLAITNRHNQILDAMGDFSSANRHQASEILSRRVQSLRDYYDLSSVDALDKIAREDRNISERLDL